MSILSIINNAHSGEKYFPCQPNVSDAIKDAKENISHLLEAVCPALKETFSLDIALS